MYYKQKKIFIFVLLNFVYLLSRWSRRIVVYRTTYIYTKYCFYFFIRIYIFFNLSRLISLLLFQNRNLYEYRTLVLNLKTSIFTTLNSLWYTYGISREWNHYRFVKTKKSLNTKRKNNINVLIENDFGVRGKRFFF